MTFIGFGPGARQTAKTLLAIADDLGLPVDVVQVTEGGFEVPQRLADEYLGQASEPSDVTDEEQTEVEETEAADDETTDDDEVTEADDTKTESDDEETEEETEVEEVQPPKGNASTEEWRLYAINHKGATEAEVADLGQRDLREKYGQE